MRKSRSKLGRKLLILLIVSAAFILARFANVSADEIKPSADSVSLIQMTKAADESNAPTTANEKIQDESLIGPMIKLIIALIVVVAGIYGFLMILRKMMGSKLSGNRGNRLIETLETTYIAQKKSVSLIRYGEKAVLVGVAEGAISVLAELDKEETSRILLENAADKREAGFKSVFAGAREKMKSFDLRKLAVSWVSQKADRPQAV